MNRNNVAKRPVMIYIWRLGNEAMNWAVVLGRLGTSSLQLNNHKPPGRHKNPRDRVRSSPSFNAETTTTSINESIHGHTTTTSRRSTPKLLTLGRIARPNFSDDRSAPPSPHHLPGRTKTKFRRSPLFYATHAPAAPEQPPSLFILPATLPVSTLCPQRHDREEWRSTRARRGLGTGAPIRQQSGEREDQQGTGREGKRVRRFVRVLRERTAKAKATRPIRRRRLCHPGPALEIEIIYQRSGTWGGQHKRREARARADCPSWGQLGKRVCPQTLKRHRRKG
ncbi:hypothetical protein CSOJ01_07055 [Colletotrichum sojae]|uniref:Uncharacterized protein n=1 Tax=Colletotrichum sojae TaxID=2175907 RepID=A0A8H6MU81_9PEZI|nr:hypothetical protein CSOJ01_07055 [Colletotrichum sojae]